MPNFQAITRERHAQKRGPLSALTTALQAARIQTAANQAPKAALLQHFNAGEFDAMASAARSLLASYPDDGKLWHWYGIACLKTGANQVAEAALRRASELLPQDANVWDHRGLILCRLGHHQLARSCFERSVALDPACAGTWSNAAKNANESGNFVEGAQYAREAVARDPAHFPGHFNLGSALKGLGQASEASRSYRRALALDPDNFSVCSSLLFCLSLDEALAPTTVFAEHLACLTPVHVLAPEEIQEIRLREHISQPVFARYLNVSKNLVSDWERGVKKPGGPALRLLTVIQKKGLMAIA